MTLEEDNQFLAYDAPHETGWIQLERLFNRRKEQVHYMHTHVHMYYCKTLLLIVKWSNSYNLMYVCEKMG